MEPQADAEIREEFDALVSFVHLCPAGLIQFGPDGTVHMSNPLCLQYLLPVSPTGLLDNVFDALAHGAPEIRMMAERFAAPRGTICASHRVVLSRAGRPDLVLSVTLLKIDSARLMAVLSDVTQQVEQERRLKEADTWLAAVFTGINDFAVFSLDAGGDIDSWNASGVRQTGFEAVDVTGRGLQCLHPPDQGSAGRFAEHLERARREGWHLHEAWCITKQGRRYWGQTLVAVLRDIDGEVSGFTVVLRDISERRITGEEVGRLLTTDHLTGAVNRGRFYDIAREEVARHKAAGENLAAAMLDVDHFKKVNDTYGHAAGDDVLRSLVEICRNLIRPSDTLARLGGEEFVLLMPGTDMAAAFSAAERVRRTVAGHIFRSGDQVLSCTISLGCATLTEKVDSVERLLSAADFALYQAKRNGRNRTCQHTAEQAGSGR